MPSPLLPCRLTDSPTSVISKPPKDPTPMSHTETSPTIQTLLQEDRSFPPSPEFVAGAQASSDSIYAEAAKDPEAWWDSWAKKLDWFEPYGAVCEFRAPFAKWFVGGKINAAYNCVDRHA